jgi:hypothetical protein
MGGCKLIKRNVSYLALRICESKPDSSKRNDWVDRAGKEDIKVFERIKT